MAYIDNSGHIVGKLGGLRYYSLNGKNIVATKGGPTAKQIKTKASYAFTRAHNDEFGIMSLVSSAIYGRQQLYKPMRAAQAHPRLRKKLFQLLTKDEINLHGQRSLLFSKAQHHFDQMPISKIPYTEYSSLKPLWNKNLEEELEFIIQEASVKSKFIFPKNCNIVQWTLAIQGIKDIEFKTSMNAYKFNPQKNLTQFLEVSSYKFEKDSRISFSSNKISINKEYNYMVFVCASYSNQFNQSQAPVHTMELIEVIPKL